MNQTISISFESPVFSVNLSSEDISDGYGILDVTSSEVVVPFGTSVDKVSETEYEYTFSVDNGHLYIVSWEIVANNGEDPYYKKEYVGPFYSLDDSDVRACATTQGTFSPGFLSTLVLRITNFDGTPVNADEISLKIYDPNGIEISLSNNVPDRASSGFYVYDWVIPSGTSYGNYVILWNYEIDGIEKSEVQQVIISSRENRSVIYTGVYYAAMKSLESYLGCSQSIPVYYEQAKPSRDYKTYRFSFGGWNQSSGVKIYRNGNIVNEGVEVNYCEGKVVFDDYLTSYDVINADYNFRWFSDEQLAGFLDNAVSELNAMPPGSGYNMINLPERFMASVIYGAARNAIRHLLMCLQFQQPAQVFGGPDGAQQAFSNFQSLKENYEKSWSLVLENKKYGPYPSLRIISVPEYTLPGGRCLSLYNKAIFKINGDTRNRELGDVLEFYKKNTDAKIEVFSSVDNTNVVKFSLVDKIWESGYKSVYKLIGKSGVEIFASKEHLFFSDGVYIPLMNLHEGSKILIYDDGEMKEDIVSKIVNTGDEEVMCDLEVSETSNLFVNGIKCHNSRWFRYMFKGDV